MMNICLITLTEHLFPCLLHIIKFGDMTGTYTLANSFLVVRNGGLLLIMQF